MNGTCWTTLSGFVQSLASNGICEIEESERGWYITYIQRDEKERLRKQRELDLARSNQDVQDRTIKHFEEERERMEKTMDAKRLHFTEADDVDISSGPIIPSFALNTVKEEPEKEKLDKSVDFNALLGDPKPSDSPERDEHPQVPQESSAIPIDTLTNEFSYSVDEKHNESWLRKGLEVKILNEKLGNGVVFKKKGEIVDLFDEFTAKVKVMNSNMVIKIDQDELQTTTPKVGDCAIVVNGPLVGEHVKMIKLLKEEDFCEVEILSGIHQGKVVLEIRCF